MKKSLGNLLDRTRWAQKTFSDLYLSIGILYLRPFFCICQNLLLRFTFTRQLESLCWPQHNSFINFLFLMQAVDKLFTNSTNRLPVLPLPLFRPTLLRTSNPLPASGVSPQLQTLIQAQAFLESQVSTARGELQMMQELFESLARAERGETKLVKKLQRRCNKDIIERHPCPHEHCKRSYSSQASLQRHVKIKHRSGRMEPPQLYNDLPPEPNLTEQTGSEEDSHTREPKKIAENKEEEEEAT